ncbi:MAG: nucleotidyltransferase family protein [Dehalococcoidia bacterium]
MRKLHLSIEEDLILLCARLQLSADQLAQLKRLVQDDTLSWPIVMEKSSGQRLNGFLFHHLQDAEIADAIPPWVMQSLQRDYLQNGFKNQRLKSELTKALQVIQQENIPVIALKGAALVETVYPNEFLRPMSDNDLLVPEDMAEFTQAKVCELGYTVAVTNEEEEETRANCQHLPKIVDSRGLVFFEIHSHLVDRQSPFRCDLSSFWALARSAHIAGSDIRVLGPEHLLMHLAVHFFLDRRFRSGGALAQICDIAETVKHYRNQIDWSFLAEELDYSGWQGPVHYGLFLAQRILGAPVPTEFIEQITPREFSEEAAHLFLQQRVFGDQRVLASQWVAPGKAYNLPNLVLGIVSRVFSRGPHPDKAEEQAPATVAKSPAWRYLCRLGDGTSLLTHYLLRPRLLWREIMADRWVHAVMSQAGTASPGERGQLLPESGTISSSKYSSHPEEVKS